jgi:hypothetical protein
VGGLRFVMVLLHAARQGFRLGKKKNGLASFLHKTISGEDYRLPSGSSNIIFFLLILTCLANCINIRTVRS